MSMREQLEAAGFNGSPQPGDTLRKLAEAAAFTVTDMATWCGQHKSAMRLWMGEADPNPVKKRYLQADMQLLEKYLACSDGLLPVPKDVRQYDRKTYVERAKADADNRFPQSHSAGARAKMLDQHP